MCGKCKDKMQAKTHDTCRKKFYSLSKAYNLFLLNRTYNEVSVCFILKFSPLITRERIEQSYYHQSYIARSPNDSQTDLKPLKIMKKIKYIFMVIFELAKLF